MPRLKILLIDDSINITIFLPPGFVCQDPLLKQTRSDKAGLDPAVKNHKTQVGVEICKLAIPSSKKQKPKKQQPCIMLMFSHKFTLMTACNYWCKNCAKLYVAVKSGKLV